jgi:hypothetical protein
MRKTGIVISSAMVLSVGLGTSALVAGAHPAAHASGCVRAKEAAGCKLNGTAYGDLKTSVIVGFPVANGPKGTPTELSVPTRVLCPAAGEVALSVKTTKTARIGGSLSFAGKAKVQAYSVSGTSPVKSAKITAKLKITDAKKASLSGKVEVTLTDGSTCSKQLPKKLTRILGG